MKSTEFNRNFSIFVTIWAITIMLSMFGSAIATYVLAAWGAFFGIVLVMSHAMNWHATEINDNVVHRTAGTVTTGIVLVATQTITLYQNEFYVIVGICITTMASQAIQIINLLKEEK